MARSLAIAAAVALSLQGGPSEAQGTSDEPSPISTTSTFENGINTPRIPSSVHLLNGTTGEIQGYKNSLEHLLKTKSIIVAVGVDMNQSEIRSQIDHMHRVGESIVDAVDLKPLYSFESVPAALYEIEPGQVDQLNALFGSDVSYLQYVDIQVELLSQNPDRVDRVGASQAARLGATGMGWNLVIPDTGVDFRHPQFKSNDGKEGGRITTSVCALLSGKCPSGEVIDDTTPHAASFCWLSSDGCMHGSATASVSTDVNEVNVIPVMIQTVGDVLVALDWVMSSDRLRFPVAAVPISLQWGDEASGSCSASEPLLSNLFQRLRYYGIAPVPGSGNNSLRRPACISDPHTEFDGVLTTGVTGLVNTTDRGAVEYIPNYSARSEELVKLLFPGDGILAADAHRGVSTPKAGTSMAAPGIGSLAAALRSKYPGITPPEIEELLFDGGDRIADGYIDYRGMFTVGSARRPNLERSIRIRESGTRFTGNILFLPYVESDRVGTDEARSKHDPSSMRSNRQSFKQDKRGKKHKKVVYSAHEKFYRKAS